MIKRAGRGRMPNGRTHSKANGAKGARATMKRHAKMSERAKKANADARKALRLKVQKKVAREQEKQAVIDAENERLRVDELLANGIFSDFISKNVGKKAINIIKMLSTPQTDEKLSADLSLKINEVRRILNVLDSYGVARYDTNKDNKGWLTFVWYLDGEKLTELHKSTMNAKHDSVVKLTDNCNDFFYCGKCYDEQKVIMPFDAAFESQFKCDNCGKQLKQLNKEEARTLFEESTAGQGELAPTPA